MRLAWALANLPLSRAWHGLAGALRRSRGFSIRNSVFIAALVIAVGLDLWNTLATQDDHVIPLANLAVENVRIMDSGVLLYDVHTLDGTRIADGYMEKDDKDDALYRTQLSPKLPLKDEDVYTQDTICIRDSTAYAY